MLPRVYAHGVFFFSPLSELCSYCSTCRKLGAPDDHPRWLCSPVRPFPVSTVVDARKIDLKATDAIVVPAMIENFVSFVFDNIDVTVDVSPPSFSRPATTAFCFFVRRLLGNVRPSTVPSFFFLARWRAIGSTASWGSWGACVRSRWPWYTRPCFTCVCSARRICGGVSICIGFCCVQACLRGWHPRWWPFGLSRRDVVMFNMMV